MSKLIDNFKQEHEAISAILTRVKRLGVHTMEGRNQLIEAKRQLEITSFCKWFFDKYSVTGGGLEFLRDFNRLNCSIEGRLQEQEALLRRSTAEVRKKQNN